MTPIFKKLNFTNQQEILVVNAPNSFEVELSEIAHFTKIVKDIDHITSIEFSIIFVISKEQIDRSIALISPKLKGDAILWFCYPKGTSKKYTCDFNRDTGWETIGKYGLEGVRQVAIDEDWSAIRFRKAEFIKNLTRRESYAISEVGKERINQMHKSKNISPKQN